MKTSINDKATMVLKDSRFLGFAEYGDPHGKPVFYFHGFPGSRLEAGRFHENAVSCHCRLGMCTK